MISLQLHVVKGTDLADMRLLTDPGVRELALAKLDQYLEAMGIEAQAQPDGTAAVCWAPVGLTKAELDAVAPPDARELAPLIQLARPDQVPPARS